MAQSAAPLYAQAFAALPAEGANSPTLPADNQATLALLRHAAERPLRRCPVALTNGVTVRLPNRHKIKICATLLRQEAVGQAARGQTDAATRAILAGFRLARLLDNEPLLISKLVEVASLGQAFDALQESLNQKSFTDAELLRLLTALGDAEPAVGFRRAMLGERAKLVAAFQSSDEKLAEAMAVEGGSEASARPLMLRMYRSGGHLQEDFAFALDFMSNLVALVALPYPQALDAAAGIQMPGTQTVLDGKLVVSAVLLPKPARFVEKGAEAVARIRLARMVLAVERYRLKHGGALPASLADLTAELSGNRFSGLLRMQETAEAVKMPSLLPTTLLKQGVNEIGLPRHPAGHEISGLAAKPLTTTGDGSPAPPSELSDVGCPWSRPRRRVRMAGG